MKSIVLIICAAAGLASCKKTYVCQCTEFVTGPGYKNTFIYTDNIKSKSKDKDSECFKHMDEKYRSQYGSEFDCTARTK